ncbi:hypothetical protein [Rhodoligotrophos ferricapiens]|uniref:hypothetical protein n=1 Tax=Rhodoligotrophos ferricapiens TaxID=3069264 RepID=UPI00315DB7BC
MSNIIDMMVHVNRAQEEAASLSKPLPKGGGGGTFGGMEARIAKLEASVESIQGTLSEVRGSVRSQLDVITEIRVVLARIDERAIRTHEKIAELPSKSFLFWSGVGLLVSIIAAVVGIITLAQ